jgi:hypothetical protein
MGSTFDTLLIDPLEHGLDAIGLMQGEYAPAKRTLAGAAVGAAFVWGVKPRLAWSKDGKTLRPWSLTSKDPDATIVPWWAMVAIPAILLGVFI